MENYDSQLEFEALMFYYIYIENTSCLRMGGLKRKVMQANGPQRMTRSESIANLFFIFSSIQSSKQLVMIDIEELSNRIILETIGILLTCFIRIRNIFVAIV
jgi:hypothetical protein